MPLAYRCLTITSILLAGLAASLLASACSTDDEPVVVVAGAPQLSVDEGDRATFDVSVVPGPSAPVVAGDFSLALAADKALYFDTLDFATREGGQVVLEVAPRCDAIGPGEGSPVFGLTVGAAGATPAEVSLQVQEQPVADCLPRVQLFEPVDGSCDPLGPEIDLDQDRLMLDAGDGATYCLRVASLSPSQETLWLRSTTNAPETLIAEVPDADELTELVTPITLLPNEDVVGPFELAVRVYRVDPDAGDVPPEPDVTRSIAFSIRGEFGIEVVGPDPAPATEFDVTALEVRVWPAQPACLCARGALDPRRAKAQLRIYDLQGNVAELNEGLCATTPQFVLRYSPPIDAEALETITLGTGADAASACTGPQTRDARFEVTSVAEQMECAGTGSDPLVACADLTGDDTPEILVGNGARQGCVFFGDEQRASLASLGDPGIGDLASGLALAWDDGTGTVRNVIIGQFRDTADFAMRELQVVGGSPPTASWVAAPGALDISGDAGVQLARVVPMSAVPEGPTTHLGYAFRSGDATPWTLELRCIATLDAGCIDDSVAVGFAAAEDVALGKADLDGNGEEDLVVFATQGGLLTVIPVDVTWVGGNPMATFGAAFASMDIAGTTIAASAGAQSGAHDALYAIDGDQVVDASLLVIPGLSAPSLDVLATPGAAVGVTRVEDRLIAGLTTGVWEYEPGPVESSWRQRDPILQEDAAVGQVPVTAAGYGRGLAACIGEGESALVFSSATDRFRYTHLDVNVVEP
jgi:hypothetical protein